jgi:uncharacterized protein YjgD (DUF1641 family)
MLEANKRKMKMDEEMVGKMAELDEKTNRKVVKALNEAFKDIVKLIPITDRKALREKRKTADTIGDLYNLYKEAEEKFWTSRGKPVPTSIPKPSEKKEVAVS